MNKAFDRLTEVLQKNLFYFEKDSSSKDNKNIKDMYFHGAWEKEGDAKWAFFKVDEENENLDLENIEKNIIEEAKNQNKKVIDKPFQLKELISKKNKKEEIVSITEMGRNMVNRYDTLQKENKSQQVPPVDKNVIKDEKRIKVFFVEDNINFRTMLMALMKKHKDIELIGWAPDGKEAVKRITKMTTLPDVILTDIAMPRMNGIEVVKNLISFEPSLKIVMLTAFGDKENVQAAFEAGATGFLRKDAKLPLIINAIKSAARGGRPLHDVIAEHVTEKILKKEEKKNIASEIKSVSEKYEKSKKSEIFQKKEFIKSVSQEIVEEIVSFKGDELDGNYLDLLMEKDITRNIAEEFINKLGADYLPSGMNKEDFIKKVSKSLMISLFNYKLKLKGL